MEPLRVAVRRRLSELYPEEEGWRIRELKAPEGLPAPAMMVARGRHVVLVDVKDEGPITQGDLVKLDRLREMFLALSAIIYYRDEGQVAAHIQREADRLGIRLVMLT
jgi:hypothetical protein